MSTVLPAAGLCKASLFYRLRPICIFNNCVILIFPRISKCLFRMFLRINRNMFRHKTFKLPCRHLLRKQLIQLFQTPPLCLWDKEEHKDDNSKITRTPNIPILWSPVQFGRIDEIGSTKRDQPSENEIYARAESNCSGTKTLRWDFGLNGPHHGTLTN